MLLQVAPERHRASVTDDRLVDVQRLDGREPGAGEPPGDTHRCGQAGCRLRRGHQGDAGDSIGSRQVVNGGGEQADQPGIAVIQAAAPGRVRKALRCYLGKIGCWHKQIMPGYHRLIGSAEVMLMALNAASCWPSSAAVREPR